MIGAGTQDRPYKMDTVLATVVLVLTVFGVVMVYSAGSERSMLLFGSPHALFLNQLSRAVVGLLLMGLTATLPYRIWRPLALPALVTALLLLAMIFIGGLGESSHGAVRWLRIGPVRFQPSEVAKFALVLFIAAWANQRRERMSRFGSGILVPLGAAGLLALLIFLQPDFSTSALLIAIALLLIFLAGAKPLHLAALVGPLLAVGLLAVRLSPYKWARVQAYLSPHADPNNASYQMLQSWIGLGRGGLFGVGLGESRQKLFFLPDAHTDFIYSVVGEEWGLAGTLALLVLFLVLIVRGLRIAVRCRDTFGGLMAAGITIAVGVYALVNMAITAGLLPTTGLPLPFISYGGTSLMLTLAAMGIVLNVSRHTVAKSPRRRKGGEG